MAEKSFFPIVFLIAAILVNSCQGEKFTEKGIPEVETLGVTLLQDGVTFHGEVLSDADMEITDHGFTWVPSANKNSSEVQYYRLGPLGNKNQFYATVNSTIEKDKEYLARAYITTGQITSYGNEITFSGIGSKPSELVSVTPASAQIGDTVVIRGNYFSNNPASCKVYFGNSSARIISSSVNELKVLVPLLTVSDVNIKVVITGIFSSNTLSFDVLLPVLTEIVPASAVPGDTVIIKGNYFSAKTSDCEVLFWNHNAVVLSSTIDEIRVIVPLTPQTSSRVTVVINGAPSVNNLGFEIMRPVLLGIEPLAGTFGDTVSLYGDNFPADPSLIEVYFNDARAVVTEASRECLRVEVPAGNNISPATITIRYFDVYTWIDKFVLNQAVLEDVSPKVIKGWVPVVISGRNFNPDPDMNIVEIGGIKADVTSSNGSEIRFTIPDNLATGQHQLSVTTIQGSPVTWDGLLEYSYPWQRMADFPEHGRVAASGFTLGDKIYFGTGYEPGVIGKKDFWEYDPVADRWSGKSDCPVYIAYATGLAIGGMGYLAIGELDNYTYTSMMRYDPQNDSWKSMTPRPGEGSTMDAPGFVVDDKAYVPAAGSMYMYDPVANTWSLKSYPQELGYFGGGAAFSINGKGYLGVGWVHEKGTDVRDFFEYDPVTDSWTKKSSFPGVARNNATSFSLPNGKGYVGMGYSSVLNQYLDDIWEYDPQADKWTQIGVFPAAPRFGARAYVVGNAAYIMTGGHSWEYERDVWKFSPIE